MQLDSALFLFEMIKREPLVKIDSAVTKFTLKVHLPIQGLIGANVFGHFYGGVAEDECLQVIDSMYSKNVHAVLAILYKEKKKKHNLTKR